MTLWSSSIWVNTSRALFDGTAKVGASWSPSSRDMTPITRPSEREQRAARVAGLITASVWKTSSIT